MSGSPAAFDGYRQDPALADLHPHRERGSSAYVWHLFDRLDDLRRCLAGNPNRGNARSCRDEGRDLPVTLRTSATACSGYRATDFIRFEYELTATVNIAAGEQVRWLPRRQASDLCLPGSDFRVFDERLVRFSHFAGNGEFLEDELTDNPSVVKLCASAFEAVWERAIPHTEYRPA